MIFNRVSQEKANKLTAINKSNAIIEFDPNGYIIDANEIFLNSVGYKINEIVGQHHSIFVSPEEKESMKYQEFWKTLNKGEYNEGIFKRYGFKGQEIWLRANYNPIMKNGKLYRIIKCAQNVTNEQIEKANFIGQVEAINRSQAVIEFDLKGNILKANSNFYSAMGYSENEVIGKHHSMFLFTDDKSTKEYSNFWDNLAQGQVYSGLFKRKNKKGEIVWLQANYNPIFDLDNKLIKVVKYATDVTNTVKGTKILESSFESLSNAVQESERGAAEANSIVGEAKERVILTHEQMLQLIVTMKELTKSAENIARITELIDSLSFQTNLLAINAKIEAAHTNSKGFAVIANEVRQLSSQSADSSKQIKRLIDTCLSKVFSSVKMVQSIGDTSKIAAQSMEKVSTTVQNIKLCAQKQGCEIDNLKRTLGSMKR